MMMVVVVVGEVETGVSTDAAVGVEDDVVVVRLERYVDLNR